ncbi:hypothetical protein FIBSPDRAFT_850695 [Athelia psychrophila]|uniref:Uncharacterized protein n=1 Tax=Athelia psychrophila TaxID=1759441 RepID=A0A166TAS3_9AGAM|nr:hypothetical protein FIBSPDRAFT_850695 [Fibularhizoctonia sp. CBS 109695]
MDTRSTTCDNCRFITSTSLHSTYYSRQTNNNGCFTEERLRLKPLPQYEPRCGVFALTDVRRCSAVENKICGINYCTIST